MREREGRERGHLTNEREREEECRQLVIHTCSGGRCKSIDKTFPLDSKRTAEKNEFDGKKLTTFFSLPFTVKNMFRIMGDPQSIYCQIFYYIKYKLL